MFKPAKTIQEYQLIIRKWVVRTMGPSWMESEEERALRFIEEAIEFVQTMSLDKERIHALVDIKYAQEVGARNQEAGGVMVTFLAACEHYDLNPMDSLDTELVRIHQPQIIGKIRDKCREKMSQGIFGKGLELGH